VSPTRTRVRLRRVRVDLDGVDAPARRASGSEKIAGAGIEIEHVIVRSRRRASSTAATTACSRRCSLAEARAARFDRDVVGRGFPRA
jgi:hypothetical protein